MKRVLFLFALCLIAKVSMAQSSDSVYHVQDTMIWYKNKKIFEKLNLDSIKSGILIDYGIKFVNMDYYRNKKQSDSVIISFPILEQINATLFSSVMKPKRNIDNPYIPQSLYETLYSEVNNSKDIILSGLAFWYQKLDTSKRENIEWVDSTLRDKYINGQWQNPYRDDTICAIALPRSILDGRNFNFRLPSSLWKSNLNNSKIELSIDADDGLGFRPLPIDTKIPIHYESKGLKNIKIKAILDDGYPFLYTIPTAVTWSESADTNFSFTGTTPFLSTANSARISIDYAHADHIIRKPLIIVEGFDIGDILIDAPAFGQSDCQESFEDFLLELESSNKLIAELSSTSYDRIYIDWNNGTDYLERNAMLLKDIIHWINTQKSGTQKGVIWGMSMGGVITRYALKDIEDDGDDHEMRLYISHDAPHQGAAVPKGIQYMANNIRDAYFMSSTAGILATSIPIPLGTLGSATIGNLLNIHNRPASREMIRDQTTSGGIAHHELWQDKLRLKGYPTSCRNVAIANGSECGIGTGIQDGQSLLSIDGRINTSLLSELLLFCMTGVTATAALASTSPIFGGEIVGLSPWWFVLPGDNMLKFHYQVNAVHRDNTQIVYDGYLKYRKEILGIIFWDDLDICAITAPPTLPDEVYSGGQYLLPIDESELSLSTSPFYSSEITSDIIDQFTFIPTTSALDIGLGDVSLPASIRSSAYVGANPPTAPYHSPFDNFVAGFSNANYDRNNEFHIRLSNRNAEFVGWEMANSPLFPNCENGCLDKQIDGPQYICNGTSGNYNIPFTSSLGSTDIVTWSIYPSIGIALDAVGASCTLTKVSSGGDLSTTLTALIHTECGISEYQKTVHLGSMPSMVLIYMQDESMGTCEYTSAITPQCHPAIESILWGGMTSHHQDSMYSPGHWPSCWSDGYIYFANAGPMNTTATVFTSCGIVTLNNTFDIMADDCYDMYRTANHNSDNVIYPNPTTGLININIPSDLLIHSISVYSGLGKLCSIYNNNQRVIDVSSLNPGLYFLVLVTDKGIKSFKIEKK